MINKYKKSALVTFLGRISDEKLQELYSGAKALLFPGIEDLGLVPIEANAAGCPVIAFRQGGAAETVKENVTGLFFDEQTPQSLTAAMDDFELNEYNFFNRQLFYNHVQQFSKIAFIKRFQEVIEKQKRF